jgi:hypothetical protein
MRFSVYSSDSGPRSNGVNNNNGNNADIELDRFKQILNNKINEKKNQIFPLHSMAYNNNVQHEINCLSWVLGITNQRIQIQISQIGDIVQNEVNKLDTTLRTKSLNMQKRDKFIMYFEILQWIRYVIQSIEEKGLHWKLTI